MTMPRVFPDTGTLVGMLVFPRDRHGRLSLAGEALRLYIDGVFDLLLSRVVVDELEEVIARDFPEQRRHLVTFLTLFKDRLTYRPTPEEIQAVLPVAVDADDAPIFAAALAAQPDIVLSNDFESFHSPTRRFSGSNTTLRSRACMVSCASSACGKGKRSFPRKASLDDFPTGVAPRKQQHLIVATTSPRQNG